MGGNVHRATDVMRLRALAVELRDAAAVALAHRSWFAPTLDDCRVDIERLLTILGPAELDGGALRSLIVRAELVLRTWGQIVDTIASGRSCWHCPCGGTLVDVARPGRLVPFRGRQLEVPADFAIPTCDRCGAERLDAEGAARLDTLLLSSFMSSASG